MRIKSALRAGSGPAKRTESHLHDRATVQRRVRAIRKFAVLMDSAVRIPGTQYRVGLDSLIGLLPGVGDAATGLLGAYIVSEAARLGVPRRTLLRMTGNLVLDFLIGAVPLVGDFFDVAWKANLRNADLLESHLDRDVRALKQRAAAGEQPQVPSRSW